MQNSYQAPLPMQLEQGPSKQMGVLAQADSELRRLELLQKSRHGSRSCFSARRVREGAAQGVEVRTAAGLFA